MKGHNLLPVQFADRMRSLLGCEYEDFQQCYLQQPVSGIRANTLKISSNALDEMLNIPLRPVPWCGEGFYYDDSFRPGKSIFYHAGLYYIQEPSAMSPGSVVDVAPGMRVLDICAAPGGKSTQLAARLQGSGVLVSNDISASRCKALVKNIELAGITNAVITTETPKKLAGVFPCWFDRILVDAPCSGEGMFRKDSDAARMWALHKSETCAAMQRDILSHAAAMLAPEGRLLYSTCTFAPMENEQMIKEFLDNNGDFELLPIPSEHFGFDVGRPGFANGWSDAAKTARIWPHLAEGEGHFIAYMQKNGDAGQACNDTTSSGSPPSHFKEFCEEVGMEEPNGQFVLNGNSLYLLPMGLPSFRGVRLARSGFYLGELKTKRFEPSQAFAMGLRYNEVQNTVNFLRDDERVSRYLKGESFDIGLNGSGWFLVCLEDYPLGWGKLQYGRLKNKYLKGWLMQ